MNNKYKKIFKINKQKTYQKDQKDNKKFLELSKKIKKSIKDKFE